MLKKIKESCEKFYNRNAFCIKENYYTYADFARKISDIKNLIERNNKNSNKIIGIITYDDIETYSSVFGVWFANCTFLPINPWNPKARNTEIIKQAGVNIILSSNHNITQIIDPESLTLLFTDELSDVTLNLELPELKDSDIIYILFTSGSTGIPKGVPVNRKNFNSFIDSFLVIGYQLDEHDKFLQIYDFSFDASLHCYVLPLCLGACVYTVPQEEIKYLYAYDLLKKHEITFAKMSPSTLSYLRPFFDKITLKKLRYSLLGGEPLYDDIAGEWASCLPNAKIQNVYGPTEATINCMYYDWNRKNSTKKTFNGIVSIGKPFGDTIAIVVDEELNILSKGETGELCVSGSQVITGYWNNPEKNIETFFVHRINNKKRIFYRTGDFVFVDNDGDYMYCGRIDHQVQIQGYRVELGEIEKHVSDYTTMRNIAIAKRNDIGNMDICLFVENYKGDTNNIYNYIKSKLPQYMLPYKIIIVHAFPCNISGKIDRNALLKMI